MQTLRLFALAFAFAFVLPPPALDAQVSDTLDVASFEAVVSIQRTRCAANPYPAAVGTVFECKYVAWDDGGFVTPATFTYSRTGGISVEFATFPDSAIATVTVTSTSKPARLIVTAADPDP